MERQPGLQTSISSNSQWKPREEASTVGATEVRKPQGFGIWLSHSALRLKVEPLTDKWRNAIEGGAQRADRNTESNIGEQRYRFLSSLAQRVLSTVCNVSTVGL